MKQFFFSLLIVCGIFILFGCGGSRYVYTPPAKPANDTLYLPFTKDLKQRVVSNKLDIKKVQFFVDQKLVLRRDLGTEKGDIKSGVILFENGRYIHEVIVPRYTPGICEVDNDDRLQISFEIQNNNIEFGHGGLNDNYFVLYARNWNTGTADLTYDGQTYKISCGSCSDVSLAKLVVRKSEADKLQKTQRVVEGRKVDN